MKVIDKSIDLPKGFHAPDEDKPIKANIKKEFNKFKREFPARWKNERNQLIERFVKSKPIRVGSFIFKF